MLPFFTTLAGGPLEELQRALEALVAAHFPMQSDEFPRGSLQRNNYMDCVRKVKARNESMDISLKSSVPLRHFIAQLFSWGALCISVIRNWI